jgi:predicted dienelactone hydrolase
MKGMYDPFERGPHPVGVISHTLTDRLRGDRHVPLEIWYPADQSLQGRDRDSQHQDRYPMFGGQQARQDALRDAAAAALTVPLVLFSHGFAGHRRQSTFFCTHLASHGYVVLAFDHLGNTLDDVVALALDAMKGGAPLDLPQLVSGFASNRPRDVSFVLDVLQAGELALPVPTDVQRVGMSGHSFGGFTTLVAAEHDPRIVAALPLAPAGGPGYLSTPALSDALTLRFEGRVNTLFLAAERDTLLPLSGIETLFQRTPEPVRMFVLENADHMHFCDRVERSHEFFRAMPQIGPMREIQKRLPAMAELVPGAHGHLFANGLGLAHFDAVLKQMPQACALLQQDVVSLLGARGIVVNEVRRV